VAEEVINEVNTTEENVADALVIVENERSKKQLQPLMILMQRKARTRRLESAMRFQC
jgi:hypothetical protein